MSAKLHQQLKQNLIWRGCYFIISLITTIITARVLGAEASGEFSFLLTILSLAVLILGINLDSAFTYFTSSKKIEINKLAYTGLVIIVVVSILGFWLFQQNFYINLINTNKLQINVYQCSVYYFTGLILFSYATGLFYGLKNFKTSNIILSSLGLIYLVQIGWRLNTNNTIEIVPDFCKMTLVAGIILYLTYIFYKQLYRISTTNFAQTKQLFSYASIIMLSNLTFFFVYKMDYAFVKSWCRQTVDLGNYIQASKFAQILLVVPQIMAGSIFPMIANETQKKAVIEIICRLSRLFCISFFGILVLSIVIGKWFFPFLLGDSFFKMYIPFCLLIPGICSLALSSLFSAYCNGTNNNKINLYGALIALLLMLVLSYSLKHFYSINMAAVISTICYVAEGCFVGVWFINKENINIKELIFTKTNDWKWLVSFITR